MIHVRLGRPKEQLAAAGEASVEAGSRQRYAMANSISGLAVSDIRTEAERLILRNIDPGRDFEAWAALMAGEDVAIYGQSAG
jgi:hypothetical protein